MNIKKNFLSITLLICTLISTASAQKKQVLLIGTFHFHNPGQDVVKQNSFDVLSENSQKHLESITDKIRKFRPTKIFVEWNHSDQQRLDTLYQLYKTGTYDAYIKNKYKKKNSFDAYVQNEVFQLGFKAAKKAGLNTVYGFDYEMGLPFDTVMKVIQTSNQNALMNGISDSMDRMATESNDKMAKLNLLELIEDLNTPKSRLDNNGFYVKFMNRAGEEGNFAGADAVATWYKRNLYMYSLIQKKLSNEDERIMILVGYGHAGMLEKFIKDENQYEIVELIELMNAK